MRGSCTMTTMEKQDVGKWPRPLFHIIPSQRLPDPLLSETFSKRLLLLRKKIIVPFLSIVRADQFDDPYTEPAERAGLRLSETREEKSGGQAIVLK